MNNKKYTSPMIRVIELSSDVNDCLLAGTTGESPGGEEARAIRFSSEEE